jgi:CDP-6-deoxy-D-xylo-4-hexulose-3-dehydrase
MKDKFKWPLINNNVSELDRDVLSKFILENDRFTNGIKVIEFEELWSKWLGINHSVMLNSGTSGNYISIFYAEWGRKMNRPAHDPLREAEQVF